jgi:colicin import membrane protein
MYFKQTFIFSIFLHIAAVAAILTYKIILIKPIQVLKIELWDENDIKNHNTDNNKDLQKTPQITHIKPNKEALAQLLPTKKAAQFIDKQIHVQKIKADVALPNQQAASYIKPKVVINTVNTKAGMHVLNKIQAKIKETQNIENIRKSNLARLMQHAQIDAKTQPQDQKYIPKNVALNSTDNIKTKGLSAVYKTKIQNIIKGNISYNANEKGIVAIVNVRIDANGNVLSHSLVKSSGDQLWDKAALQATKESDPFPKPESNDTINITLHIKAD